LAFIDGAPRPRGKFQLLIHSVALEDIEPLGDRYVLETIDLDEKIELGRILVVTQDAIRDPRDPSSDPRLENRGVIAGVIVRAGNGHLLGLPDPAFVAAGGGDELLRGSADVPMFCEPGDVVLVDHNAKGRALKILGREGRVINQIDVLAKIEGIRLRRVGDEWEPE
jgi:co-chaperonin GroES (HSP10)